MKVTIELPEWTKIISVTAFGFGVSYPMMNASVRAFAVKDGDTVKVPEVEEES